MITPHSENKTIISIFEDIPECMIILRYFPSSEEYFDIILHNVRQTFIPECVPYNLSHNYTYMHTFMVIHIRRHIFMCGKTYIHTHTKLTNIFICIHIYISHFQILLSQ